MASVIPALLCVLASLAASGHALSCKVCMASYSLYCDGASMVCPAGQVCITAYTLTTLGDSKLSEVLERACAPRSQCDSLGSISVFGGKIKRATACCSGDHCTPKLPTLPEDNHEPNGVTCATCATADSDWCYTEDTLRCTGNENMCILESTYQYEPAPKLMAVRGCATRSICAIGRQEVSIGSVNMTMDIKCTSASSPLRAPLLLLTAILLVIIS